MILNTINGIKPQSKLWTLTSAASYGKLNHSFSSAEAVREGGSNNSLCITPHIANGGGNGNFVGVLSTSSIENRKKLEKRLK